MKIRIHKSQQVGATFNQGFSLVELLLTLVLILCLAAASVFTFTAIYQASNLDEGVDRFQSLIRFAQAEAATTGRKVRLQFVPAPSDSPVELRDIKVTWEADLLNAPGVFQEYTNKAWSEQIVNELVGVQTVKPIQSARDLAPAPLVSRQTADDLFAEEEFPSITFYPDGSCDSAEIVLASKNSDDARRLAVRLSGLLGSVSTRTLPAQNSEAFDESTDLDSEYDFESEYSSSYGSAKPLESSYSAHAP